MKTNIWQLGQNQYTEGRLLPAFPCAVQRSNLQGLRGVRWIELVCPTEGACVYVHVGVCCTLLNFPPQLQKSSKKIISY